MHLIEAEGERYGRYAIDHTGDSHAEHYSLDAESLGKQEYGDGDGDNQYSAKDNPSRITYAIATNVDTLHNKY